jgi:predicted acetyltransferase
MIEVRQVDRSCEAIVRNLLEHYCHDMAEWFLLDAHEDGSYRYLPDQVWSDGVDVHLAYLSGIPIGFALVGSAAPYAADAGAKDLKEFFVVRRHRRSGIGRMLAERVWNLYPGKWLVRVYHGNRPALPFWRAAIGAYTGDAFAEEVRTVEGRSWSHFTFDGTATQKGEVS